VKHAWLAIDPGLTTGWALLGDNGALLGTSVWGTSELKLSLDILVRQCHVTGYDVTVVIEQMPYVGNASALAKKLDAVRRDIMSIVKDTYELKIVMVTPGEWKPSRVARTTQCPSWWNKTRVMVHQKDAIRMGRYVISIGATYSEKEA